MVKNTVMQEYVDRIKWSQSNKYQTDMSGKMTYCKFCKFAIDGGCKVEHADRVENCYCAKAFNKMKKGGTIDA